MAKFVDFRRSLCGVCGAGRRRGSGTSGGGLGFGLARLLRAGISTRGGEGWGEGFKNTSIGLRSYCTDAALRSTALPSRRNSGADLSANLCGYLSSENNRLSVRAAFNNEADSGVTLLTLDPGGVFGRERPGLRRMWRVFRPGRLTLVWVILERSTW